MRYMRRRKKFIGLFIFRKRLFESSGFLNRKGASEPTKEMFFSMLFNSPHQANVKHKKYKLWTDIIFEG